MLLSRFYAKLAPVALGLLSMPVLTGCSDFMHDDLPECDRNLRVKLSYTRNMAFEERVSQVPSARVYAFDANGQLAGEGFATPEELAANDWTVNVPVQKGGDFRIVVWCGVDNSPFSLDGTRAVSTMDDLTCRLGYDTHESGYFYTKQDLPGLYHGTCSTTFHIGDLEQEVPVSPLTKNTNTFEVLLHNEANVSMDASEFTFVVTDDNAVMGHDNLLRGEGHNVQYHAINVESGKRELPADQVGETETVAAIIPLARLTSDTQGRLYIYRGEKELVNMPVKDLLEACHEHEAPQMDHQEYLDRQDSYTVRFFINWEGYVSKTLIYINDWAIVNQDVDF